MKLFQAEPFSNHSIMETVHLGQMTTVYVYVYNVCGILMWYNIFYVEVFID